MAESGGGECVKLSGEHEIESFSAKGAAGAICTEGGDYYHTLVSRLVRARLKSGSKAGAHGERSQSGPLVSGFIEAILPSGVGKSAALEVVTPSGFIIRGAEPEAVAALVRSLCI